MPELPEVETIRLGLITLLPGQTIKKVEVLWPKSFEQTGSYGSSKARTKARQFSTFVSNNKIIGAKILDIERRGKVLIIELSSKYSLVTHLKMTGQLVYRASDNKVRFGAGHPTDSLIGRLPDRSTRVVLTLSGGKLFFNDQRKFGWMRLLPTAEVPNIDFFKRIGPEPLEANFTAKQFIVRIRRRAGTSIKAALLDQTVIAGVGNIYADESLFAAKIHPATMVKNVSDQKLSQLFVELIKVLKLSIKKGGSTDRNYVNHEGKKGSYLSFAKVFRKNSQPCPRCGTTIQKIRVAGRGTHVCPSCQRPPRKNLQAN